MYTRSRPFVKLYFLEKFGCVLDLFENHFGQVYESVESASPQPRGLVYIRTHCRAKGRDGLLGEHCNGRVLAADDLFKDYRDLFLGLLVASAHVLD
jgi:hypothetical protein